MSGLLSTSECWSTRTIRSWPSCLRTTPLPANISRFQSMKNPRITHKERGLLKGAVRRVFSRSELRAQVVAASRIDHQDPERPRVKKWSRCASCKLPTATYQMQVDHIEPLQPIGVALDEMSMDDLVNRAWCDVKNLQALCLQCHKAKSKLENAERRKLRKGTKKGSL